MLDSQARISAAFDITDFGYGNRGALSAQTAQPYPVNQNGTVLGSFNVALASGMTTEARVLMNVFETEPGDGARLVDGAANQTALISQHSRGPAWTDWLSLGNSSVDVSFYSDATQTANDTGVAAMSFEYRRFQTGASYYFIPLRFPGQYQDIETDWFENWNRNYDPSTGRYLQPEPMQNSPRFVKAMAAKGMTAPVYAYSNNNPLSFFDANGLWTLGFGGQASGNLLGAGASVSAGVYVGWSDGAGFTYGVLGSISAGPAGPLVSGSFGGFLTGTNSNDVAGLKGPGVQVGGSGGEGHVCGGDFVAGQGVHGGPIFVGAGVNVGVGGGFPVEGHFLGGSTGGWDSSQGWK